MSDPEFLAATMAEMIEEKYTPKYCNRK